MQRRMLQVCVCTLWCWVEKGTPRTLGSLAKPLVMVKEGRARSQDVMGVVLSPPPPRRGEHFSFSTRGKSVLSRVVENLLFSRLVNRLPPLSRT